MPMSSAAPGASRPEPTRNVAQQATVTLQQYGIQLAQNMQRDGAIRGSPTFQRCIPLPGDVRIPTPRKDIAGGPASTAAPRTPKPRRSSSKKPVALSLRRENMCDQLSLRALDVLIEESSEQFGPHYDENHRSPNGRKPPTNGKRQVSFGLDAVCCHWWERPCRLCRETDSNGSPGTPMASSPPDRAPDSPRQTAQLVCGAGDSANMRREAGSAARKPGATEMRRQTRVPGS